MPKIKLTMGGLFSGIGGFELGAQQAGVKPVWSNDIDPFGCAILRKNFNHLIINEDVQEIKRLATVDIVCAGFPCQPFSYAGLRKGSKDNRHLWPQVIRIAQIARPTWIVCENVLGLTTMVQPDRTLEMESNEAKITTQNYILEDIRRDLDEIGYESAFFVIPACAVGKAHRRDRIWIVAYSNSNDKRTSKNGHYSGKKRQALVRTEGPREKGSWEAIFDFGRNTLSNYRLSTKETPPNPTGKRGDNPSKQHENSESEKVKLGGGNRKDCFIDQRGVVPIRWLEGFYKSPILRIYDGVPSGLDGLTQKERFAQGILTEEEFDKKHYELASKALGNAIVPEIAKRIFEAILYTYQ